MVPVYIHFPKVFWVFLHGMIKEDTFRPEFKKVGRDRADQRIHVQIEHGHVLKRNAELVRVKKNDALHNRKQVRRRLAV